MLYFDYSLSLDTSVGEYAMSAARSHSRDRVLLKIQQVFDRFNQAAEQRSHVVGFPVLVLCTTFFLANEGAIKQFDAELMRKAYIIDASSEGTATIRLDVGMEYSNEAGETSCTEF